MSHQLQHSEILCPAHNAFTCFAWISEETATFSLCRTNFSAFITEAQCLLRDTNWVFKSDRYNFVPKGLTLETDASWTLRVNSSLLF